ncbi:MAG: hypothetical protein GWP91_04935 [Rhodobacterales bacterium]|nr:hypothetical protein [Rhodobacterales bacterium]
MNNTAKLGLKRLRAGLAVDELALLVVQEATATPLREVASPRWIASQIATALEAATAPSATEWLSHRIDAERGRWSDDERKLSSMMPEEVDEPLRQLLLRNWSANEQLTHRLVDQPAIRDLLRHILTDGINRFRKRITNVDDKLGGLGRRAASRGKGLLGGFGRVSGMAEDIMGAVREEVGHGMDGRVGDFVRGALSEQVRSVARYLADPEHAESFANLRVSILDVLLDTPISELVGEADKLGPKEILELVRGAVSAAIQTNDFVDRTETRVAALMDEVGDGTLGAWLEEVGLLDVWTETTAQVVADRLHAVVKTPAFEDWWTALHAPE